MGMALLTAICPQKAAAQAFTGKDFLGWTQTAQDSYFQTSITMASIIATKTRKASGDCIAAWYLDANADRSARNDELRATIWRNDGYHPSAVIFLVLEQECGPFS